MPSRNEPMHDMPSMRPERDEVRSFNTARASKAGLGGWAKFFLFLTFLLAATGLAGAGYLFLELQKSASELQAAVDRVVELENRLSITDESVSDTTEDQQGKIQNLGAKLSALSSTSGKNKSAIAAQAKTLNALSAANKTANGKITAQASSLQVLQSQLAAATALADEFKSVQSQAVAQGAQVSELADSMGSVREGVSSLNKRMRETEEWVESINGYRRQVNEKLSTLESQLPREAPAPF